MQGAKGSMLSITMVRTQCAGGKRQYAQYYNSEDSMSRGKRQYAQYYNGEDSMCRGQKAVCSVLQW